MNHFILNGKEVQLSTHSETIAQLLAQINSEYTHAQSIITSIQIDGIDMNFETEQALADTSIQEVDSVIVQTAHPKEFIEDTLMTLEKFTDRLIAIAEDLAVQIENNVQNISYERLIEGIEVFTDTLSCAKSLMRVGMHPKLQVLEVDLASILRDLTNAREQSQQGFQVELLRDHLIDNLLQWKAVGIPTLIRSRDS